MANSGSKKSHLKRSKTSLQRRKKSERIGSDAAEQRMPEDQDSKKEEMYKTLVENIPCAAYSAFPGETGPTTFMSKNWKDWTGYSAEEFYQDPEAWPKCIYPDDREKAVKAYIEACRNEAPYNLEYRIVHRETGQVRYVRDQGLLSKDSKGTLIRVDGIITDITEVKTSENELVKYRDHLEELVKERTAELEKANEALKLKDKEREKAEEKLHQYDHIVSSSTDMLALLDKKFVYMAVNSSYLKAFGKIPDKVIGHTVSEVFGKEFFETVIKPNAERCLAREEVNYQAWFDFPAYEPIYMDINYYPYIDSNNEVLGFVVNGRDITDRKQTEEALAASELKYRSLFDNSIEGIGLSMGNRVISANKALLDIFGYDSVEEFTKIRILDHVAPESREMIRGFMEKAKKGDVLPATFEYKIICKNGLLKDIEISTVQVSIEGQKYTQSTFRDITEHKKAAIALRDSEEKYRTLFEAASDGILTVKIEDEGAHFVECNSCTLSMFRCSREEFIGKSPADFSPPLQPDGISSVEKVTKIAKAAMAGESQYFEWTHRRLDETQFDAEVTLDRINVAGETYLQAIVRDITERKKAERRIQEYQEKLKSLASQLSLVEEHERRRIATELHDQIGQSLVFSKIKLDELHHSATSSELTKALDEICNNISQIIQDTRTLTFDLSSPILNELGFEAAVADWLDVQIGEKHGIKTEFEDDGQPKPLDEDIQSLLFRNVRELLVNVIKHAKAQNVKVSVSKVDELINISVEDNGKGFDPTEVASKATFGLFSIRERLEQLDGSFEIKSEPGHGSKFTMTAPLKRA